jgi:hypothetical protein
LRMMLLKLTRVDSRMTANSWGPVYYGGDYKPLDQEELQLRVHVLKGTLAEIIIDTNKKYEYGICIIHMKVRSQSGMDMIEFHTNDSDPRHYATTPGSKH